jgi:hypothetical protein
MCVICGSDGRHEVCRGRLDDHRLGAADIANGRIPWFNSRQSDPVPVHDMEGPLNRLNEMAQARREIGEKLDRRVEGQSVGIAI